MDDFTKVIKNLPENKTVPVDIATNILKECNLSTMPS